jgi:hypothetical protein
MKFCRLVVAATLLLAPAGLAQSTAASREQILKLFEVMNIRQQMRSTMEGVLNQQSSMVRDGIRQRYPQITEEEMAHMSQYLEESLKAIPVDGMIEDMIPVYQKHLNRDDVDAMISFYSSATGQKLMQEMPAMTSEGMQAAYPRMQEEMEKVMQRVEEKMREKAPKKKGTSTSSNETES